MPLSCAAIYGNEAEIGEAFAEAFKAGVLRREELFVTSKLWNSKHVPADVRGACEKTLSDLGLSYLDLYIIHWPMAYPAAGPEKYAEVPLTATWGAMEGARWLWLRLRRALAARVCVLGQCVRHGAPPRRRTRLPPSLADLVGLGLVRAIGVSNFNSRQLAEVSSAARIRIAVNQARAA